MCELSVNADPVFIRRREFDSKEKTEGLKDAK